jgi:hypothetical protein
VFAGIDVGTGVLTVEILDRNYRLALDGIVPAGDKSSGARATAHVTGSILRGALAPSEYSASLERAGAKSRVALGFANGALAMVAVLPPGAAGSGRTRPSPQQSRGVIDPLSALAMPAAPANLAPLSTCGRTQRVFGGLWRYDITLFPSRIEPIEIKGKQFSSLVCRAEMRSAIDAPMTDRQRRAERWPDIRPRGQRAVVWLAPVAGGRLLVPVRIESRLRYGTLTIEATDANPFTTVLHAALR